MPYLTSGILNILDALMLHFLVSLKCVFAAWITRIVLFPFLHSVDHLSCAGLPKSPVDPCSRESVLKVLKETRKRNVEDEDRSFTTEQRNKRR